MTDQPKKENRKPWDHTIRIGINHVLNVEGQPVYGSEVQGMVATCTCGEFAFPFAEGTDPEMVIRSTAPHMESHPLPPVSTAALGDDSVVLVMAIPGSGDSPVHMSITVSMEVYEDGARLARHLGSIGSPQHFQIFEQRQELTDRMRGAGFHAISLPSGIGGIEKILDMLRNTGHEIQKVEYMEPDGTVHPLLKPPGDHSPTSATDIQRSEDGDLGFGITGFPVRQPGEGYFPTIGKKPANWPGFQFGGSIIPESWGPPDPAEGEWKGAPGSAAFNPGASIPAFPFQSVVGAPRIGEEEREDQDSEHSDWDDDNLNRKDPES